MNNYSGEVKQIHIPDTLVQDELKMMTYSMMTEGSLELFEHQTLSKAEKIHFKTLSALQLQFELEFFLPVSVS